MWLLLPFTFIAISQASYFECESEWGKILQASQDILSPNPSDYTKMFLYSGFMINDLGQYDPCNDLSISKYTLIVLFPYPSMLIALCGPKVCTAEDYQQLLANHTFYQTISEKIQFHNPLIDLEQLKAAETALPVIFPKEYIDDNFEDFSTGAILMITFICIVGVIGLYATSLEYYLLSKKSKEIVAEKAEMIEPRAEDSTLVKLVLCFSLISNTKKLFVSRSQERLGKKDSMELLNSVRVLSISWVLNGHVLLMLYYVTVISNADTYIKEVSKSQYIIPLAGEFAVDTFFWVSGFLVTYLLIHDINNSKKMNWLMIYVHRYLRITPLYLFCILLFWALQKHIGNGPIFFTGDIINNECKNHWWTNILYLNNFIPKGNGSGCFTTSWYLANDMQFFIITPPILYIYHRLNKVAAWGISVALIFESMLSSGLIVNHYGLNAVTQSLNNTEYYFDKYYNKPYCRIGVYFVGVLTGIIVYSYRKYQNKNEVYDKISVWVGRQLENKAIRYAVGLFGLTLINLLIFVQYDTFKHPGKDFKYDHWNNTQNVIFLAFGRVSFGIGLTCLCLPAFLGHFTWMTWILTWDLWTPLARLSFCVYLIHYNILDMTYRSIKTATVLNEFTLIRDSVFFIILAYIISIPIVLLIEMPAFGIEKVIFSSTHRKSLKQDNKQVQLEPLVGNK
ncbi:unnamed protein product [Blepharisma stoltei]|uniref:Acyltransferase 3 domain-containing protein n=1 Tax=Blepharisma stoltei TaxID=1481888 RepID=A0AAU9K1G6_9CILI|nr:unnamed protein product [Blepharisma stoltei]